jgi:hypothetical protein
MTLNDYYTIVLQKLQNKEYTIFQKDKTSPKPVIDPKHLENEAINYMIYEYMEDNKDKRRMNLFDYFLKPKGLETNFDFTTVTFEEFFNFMISIKN